MEKLSKAGPYALSFNKLIEKDARASWISDRYNGAGSDELHHLSWQRHSLLDYYVLYMLPKVLKNCNEETIKAEYMEIHRNILANYIKPFDLNYKFYIMYISIIIIELVILAL